ncbi:peroxidasin-like isoform X2 [Haliotis asinina]|uniref:peroxidasin-like isoform X2 n=1 Tax=Haliotis asinina TaxID=109174 RepID=UPI003531DF24
MDPRLLLILLVFLCQREGTFAVQLTGAELVSAEIQKDREYLATGVDRLGGTSTTEQHASFTSTKPTSVRLGQQYREKLFSGTSSVDDCPSTVECNVNDKFRSADGSCNNLANPDWGQSFIPMRRFLPPQYGDGISLPRTIGSDGSPLASPRLVSTTLHTADVDTTSQSDVTHMVMQWAQFLDHDFASTAVERGADGSTITCCEDDVPDDIPVSSLNLTDRRQCFPIPVPDDDRRFNRTCLNFVRSVQIANADCNLAPGEQLNQLTAFVDASQVYGSTKDEQDELRSFVRGLLRTSFVKPDLLPRNPVLDCITFTEPNFCFLAGDERVDEHMSLASMHTIWLREHNRVARKLARINPHWDDERLFQETRRIVGAMIQHITFVDFLSLVLSPKFLVKFGLLPSTGPVNIYNDSVDASIHNAFATAAYRFGHSMIRSFFSRPNRGFKGGEDLQLRDSFGNTSIIISSDGDAINQLTRGLLIDRANSVDRHVSPELTDFLFPDDEGNSLDLMSLNIQRGRDHGLPGYNDWRRWCGLPEAANFSTGLGGLVDHPEDAASSLETLYRTPDDIDLFSGGVSERPVDGGLLGETFSCIVGSQFELLKIGDRFWYETDDAAVGFTVEQLAEIRKTSLSRVVCDNTDTVIIQPNAFKKAGPRNRIRLCRQLPEVDLWAWQDSQGKCGSECGFRQWGPWGHCVLGCRFRRRVRRCRACAYGSLFQSQRCRPYVGYRYRGRCNRLYSYLKLWY